MRRNNIEECTHTGIGLAVAVGPSGRCAVPGLHFQRVRSLLLSIEHHLREDLPGLPINLEVILPFVSVAVHHVISDLKPDYPLLYITVSIIRVRFLLNNLWHAYRVTSNEINYFSLRFCKLLFVYVGFPRWKTKLSSRQMVKIVRVIWFIKIEKSYMICHRWTYVSGIRWPIYTSQTNTCCWTWNCMISKLLEDEEEKNIIPFPPKLRKI